MAKIKCRFRQYRCYAMGNAGFCGLLNCVSGNYDIDCGNCSAWHEGTREQRYESEFMGCIHAKSDVVEFEKEVKAYELDTNIEDGYLKARGIYIDIQNIDYLEIDGEVKLDFENNSREFGGGVLGSKPFWEKVEAQGEN